MMAANHSPYRFDPAIMLNNITEFDSAKHNVVAASKFDNDENGEDNDF